MNCELLIMNNGFEIVEDNINDLLEFCRKNNFKVVIVFQLKV